MGQHGEPADWVMDYYEGKDMMPYEVIRNAIPDAPDGVCEHILWGRTGFPGFWHTDNPAKEIYRAAHGYQRACTNGIDLCDHCHNPVMAGKYTCKKCFEALRPKAAS